MTSEVYVNRIVCSEVHKIRENSTLVVMFVHFKQLNHNNP